MSNHCSTCGHETFLGLHLGYHEMDLHHVPTGGVLPQNPTGVYAYASSKTWFADPAGGRGDYYAGITMHDGTDNWIRSVNGVRTAVTAADAEIAYKARLAKIGVHVVAVQM